MEVAMDRFANLLIDALGGTTSVANKAFTGVSTVHHWRKNGLPASRLDHLRRIAQDEGSSEKISAIAAECGVDLPNMRTLGSESSGNADETSRKVLA
jgi:hypothetical protein